MPKLDIDDLLEKNRHIDGDAVRRRQQAVEEQRINKRPTKQWPLSPYGRQKRGDARWGSGAARSHYRPRKFSN